MKHHPDWKLPSRRVRKFLKRHLNNHLDPSGADDDATILTAKETTPARRFIKLLKRRVPSKSTSNSIGTIPEVSPTMSEESPAVGLEEEPEPKVDVNPQPQILQNTRSLEQTYSDDNDGSKNDCKCFLSFLM